MQHVKRSVSLLIHSRDRDKILLVQRPSDDEDLPDVWGLAASSLKEDETEVDAVLRTGLEKLSVSLSDITPLNAGRVERPNYILEMRLYKSQIDNGEINVGEAVSGQTNYQSWQWGNPELLIEAARKGSLCSILCLKYLEIDYD